MAPLHGVGHRLLRRLKPTSLLSMNCCRDRLRLGKPVQLNVALNGRVAPRTASPVGLAGRCPFRLFLGLPLLAGRSLRPRCCCQLFPCSTLGDARLERATALPPFAFLVFAFSTLPAPARLNFPRALTHTF